MTTEEHSRGEEGKLFAGLAITPQIPCQILLTLADQLHQQDVTSS